MVVNEHPKRRDLDRVCPVSGELHAGLKGVERCIKPVRVVGILVSCDRVSDWCGRCVRSPRRRIWHNGGGLCKRTSGAFLDLDLERGRGVGHVVPEAHTDSDYVYVVDCSQARSGEVVSVDLIKRRTLDVSCCIVRGYIINSFKIIPSRRSPLGVIAGGVGPQVNNLSFPGPARLKRAALIIDRHVVDKIIMRQG